MDAFVMPSLFEGLGIALIEAQASGLKCITSANVVSSEADVTDLLERISLDKPATFWANHILQSDYFQYERRNTIEDIKAAGYDITDQVIKLEEFYLDKSRLSI